MAKQKGTTAKFIELLTDRLFKGKEAEALVRLGICLIVGVVLTMAIGFPMSMLSMGWLANTVIYVICTCYLWAYMKDVWKEAGGDSPTGVVGYICMALPFFVLVCVGPVVSVTGSVFLMASGRAEQ